MYWLNGEFYTHAPSIAASQSGFLLGDGCFATMRIEGNQILAWQLHYERLKAAIRALAMTISFDEDSLVQAIKALVDRAGFRHSRIRITCWRASEDIGLSFDDQSPASVMIQCTALDERSITPPLKLWVSDYFQAPQSFASYKLMSYALHRQAMHQARRFGYGDAIISKNEICSELTQTSCRNLFLLNDNRLITPAINDGVLAGTRRSIMLSVAMQHNIEVEQRPITRNDCQPGAIMFTTNAIDGVRPVELLQWHEHDYQFDFTHAMLRVLATSMQEQEVELCK